LAEPFRILVWSSFPMGLDDHSAKHLRSLLDTGTRCGIIPILLIDPNTTWQTPELQALVERRGLHLNFDATARALRITTEPLAQLPLCLEQAASEDQASAIVQSVGRSALLASRVEVPLEQMLPTVAERWLGDSSHVLEIPIGQSGVGRVQSLKLGLGTAQHAILAGKTGSGKSSLLHAMITSAALKYSPEQLRMVLLDFKKGVEFQVYAEVELPHADIIGIESHREFGLSALEYVDACMQRRGEAFRQEAVQDIASWNQRHPGQPMPRMLFMIDEFQELFVEDDKLASQASLILDRIVRQGRSFGVHAILSSQTLAGAYSLPRTTLGQMAVRIALQCDASDAQIIFADDNPAAQRLKFPGQAIYNDAGGRIEGNHPMQVGWLSKQQQISWLRELTGGYRNQDPTTNRLGRSVIFDGNRAAKWDQSNAELALSRARAEVNSEATWCLVGESVAISPAVVFPLTLQAGRNMLLVGGEDQIAAPVLAAIAASWANACRSLTRPQLLVIQGAKPTDAWVQKLPHLWRELPCDLQCVDIRGADGLLKSAHELLQARMSQDDSEHQSPEAETQLMPPPILVCILQLGRLRTLRRDEDFGMGGFGETELKPDKLLEELLRDGPSHGIHTLVWAENYSTVQRWLSRSALREMEIRLLMRMSGSDSTNLIDSIAASRLSEQVMLIYDEATGQEQKFRPFGTATLDSITTWKPNTVATKPPQDLS
jgi:S-DNA-T family DNA segregation ATPase FtsK/SpoIIIE